MIPSPQADVVLQRKQDPINNLRKLRHHGQQRNAEEILQKEENLKVVSLQPATCSQLKMQPWF